MTARKAAPPVAEPAVDAPKPKTKKQWKDELYAAYDFALQNAADPVAQKAFRQKFQEVLEHLAHKE